MNGLSVATWRTQAFGNTDFRDDLAKVTVSTLVLHGDGDVAVPFESSGARTHAAIPTSELVVLRGAPHGCNVSHADKFNDALLAYLDRLPGRQLTLVTATRRDRGTRSRCSAGRRAPSIPNARQDQRI